VLPSVIEQIDLRLRDWNGVEFWNWNEKNLAMAKAASTEGVRNPLLLTERGESGSEAT